MSHVQEPQRSEEKSEEQVHERVEKVLNMLSELDSGRELSKEELKELVDLIDYVDEAHYNPEVEKLYSSTEFKLGISHVPLLDMNMWEVNIGEDWSNYRVAGGVVELGNIDTLVVRNYSEAPKTKKELISTGDPVAAKAFAAAMGIASSSGHVAGWYDCVDFWSDNVKTEAFKCVGDESTMYFIVAPHIVYAVHRTKDGKSKYVAVKNKKAVEAFHILFNTPM